MAATLLENIASFVDGYIGRLPVYWRGNQIGYADFLKNGERNGIALLCQGTLQTFVGVETGNPAEWTTRDAWGRLVPVSIYCAGKGVQAKWLTPEQKAAATVDPMTGKISVPGLTPSPAMSVPVMIAAGAAALGVLLLVTRR